jgi:cytochrome c-type biogenesis protein CcmE
MKKLPLIVIAGIIVSGIAIMVSAMKDVSTYATFEEAESSGRTVKVVGELARDREMHYDPLTDPNYFTFFIKDRLGEARKVVLKAEKPQDFERSEQIVVTGKMREGDFVASDILMKCPSKYKDEEVYIKSAEG